MMRIFILIFSLIGLISCAPLPEEGSVSSVVLKMPSSDRSKRSSSKSKSLRGLQNVRSSKIFPGTTLSIIDDVDCYVVAISNGGSGTCAGDIQLNNIKILSETVPDGGEIILQAVPTLTNLGIHVIGFSKGTLNVCPDFRVIDTASITAMGKPAVVGSVNVELQAIEENVVDIDLQVNAASSISSCGGFPFDWAVGGVFGTARFGQSKFGP